MIKHLRETVLCHRNACSHLRHQGSVQLTKPLWHLCDVLRDWHLQRKMDLTTSGGCGCFHMLLQVSPSFVTVPYWNALFRAAGLLLAAPSPVKAEQEESFDAHPASPSRSTSYDAFGCCALQCAASHGVCPPHRDVAGWTGGCE